MVKSSFFIFLYIIIWEFIVCNNYLVGYFCYMMAKFIILFVITATTPPLVDSFSFPSNASLKIYVPSGSVTAYQSAWSDYSSKIEPIA